MSLPWICPRCTRVYGPGVSQCQKCNHAVDQKEQPNGTIEELKKRKEPWIIPVQGPNPWDKNILCSTDSNAVFVPEAHKSFKFPTDPNTISHNFSPETPVG